MTHDDITPAVLTQAPAESETVDIEAILQPQPQPPQPPQEPEELLLQASRKVTIRCGKSSITLHPNGKIVLRGEYILSDAEGVNRIAGGHIELN